ncbi:inactive serine protease 54-like [Amblyraja radiata]|uniref:inactive serine protease 54-like n=1 Tax=Amblyraja radiata TaxID=386614 RepID=UPI0014025F37|nr:inactive serine protease 54-like [Amblyraja radiata]
MQIIYGVHKVILHEYFILELFGVKIPDNDIALVMVKEPIVFNKLVSPICFPDDRYLDMSTLENCWVTGWQMLSLAGSPISPIYQTVKQPVNHEKLEVCEKFYPENLKESVICVTNVDKQQSLCMGGYGAPLECQDKRTKMWVVAGAASHCPPSCNHTALFTSYVHYVDWVERVTISAGHPFVPYGLPPKPTLPCHQIQHPKRTLPSHKLQHHVECNPWQKPKRTREARRQWKGRHHKVIFESNSSNAERKPRQVLGAAVCLVQLALLT